MEGHPNRHDDDGFDRRASLAQRFAIVLFALVALAFVVKDSLR